MLRSTLIAATLCCCIASGLTFAKGHRMAGKRRRGNYTVFKYPMMAEARIHLKRVKVRFSVRATVKPSKIKSTLATLRAMAIDGSKPLEVNRFNQNKTATGLINIQATLSGILSVAQLQSAYNLATRYSRSGMMVRVASVQPYFPLAMQQKRKQALSLKMYGMAEKFASQLASQSGKPFKVSMINFNPKGGQYRTPAPAMQQYTMTANKVSDAQASLPLLQVIKLKAMVVLKAKQKRARPQPGQLSNADQLQPHHHQSNQAKRPRRQPRHRYPGQMH